MSTLARQVAADLPSGERCLVLNVDGELYAVSAFCTHRELSMEGGTTRAGSLVCPWHRARFDLKTGAGTRPAPRPVKTFEVAVVDGNVLVRQKEGD